jgi:hypothetical protein
VKKSTSLLLFMAGTALFLSGCSIFTDIAYPGQSEGSNSVTFDITGASANAEISANAGEKLWVMLYESGSFLKAGSVYMRLNSSSGNYAASIEFINLDDGVYSAYAWLDSDGNNNHDAGEPEGTSAGTGLSDDAELKVPITIN